MEENIAVGQSGRCLSQSRGVSKTKIVEWSGSILNQHLTTLLSNWSNLPINKLLWLEDVFYRIETYCMHYNKLYIRHTNDCSNNNVI